MRNPNSKSQPPGPTSLLSENSGIHVGQIVSFSREDGVFVDFPGNTGGPRRARVAGSLSRGALQEAYESHSNVLMVFEGGEPELPIVLDTVTDLDAKGHETVLDEIISQCNDRAEKYTKQSSSSEIGMKGRLCSVVGITKDGVLVNNEDGTGEPQRVQTAINLRTVHEKVLVLDMAAGQSVIIGQIIGDSELKLAEADTVREIRIDAESIHMEARTELVLQCGKSRVHLDARGKIVVTSDQIVSRAKGANKVQGGSVQLN
ncbi:MAG: hypothetical protein HY348_10125 [Nitrospira defluvii]|nr:hypothetical protein [Nitrospira defluvii]